MLLHNVRRTSPLRRRKWELRHACKSYDVAYSALTEALDITLTTADMRPGAGVRYQLRGRDHRLTGFLAAGFGFEPGVRSSCLSPGAARRSEWSGLAVDVLLDDGRGCAWAGDGEIGRRSRVAAYAGADTRAGEFALYRVGGAALEALGESG
jgi:hypothetical protein